MSSTRLFRWAFTLVALAAFVNATPGAAQQRGTIRGTVREADTQRPVPGVQVFIPGTQMATVTDAQGRYEFTGVPVGGVQVRVRAVGYSAAFATTTVVGGQTVTVDFALNRSVIALDEVVVTGTGATAERRQLGNTIATVRADVIEEAPIANFSEALAAREAGVQILPASGLAGEGARIRIRGNASLSQSNEPVVYVDGVRIDNGGGLTNVGTGGGGVPSRLDDINPEIIERIEILKGAAAATLYGSEASAGVIQIFTKRGTQGRPRFSVRIDQGLSRFPADRIKPAAGFARNQAQADRINAILGRGFMTDATGDGRVDPYEVFEVPLVTQYYGTGYHSAYSATVTGGGSDAVYNVAARYSRDDGPISARETLGPGMHDFNRKVQTSANVTMFPRDRLNISAGLLYSDVFHTTPNNNNNIYGVQSSLLNSKPENANCQESINRGLGGPFGEDPNRPGHCAGPGNEWGTLAFTTPREAAQAVITQNAEHVNANVKVSYEPLTERLRLEGTVGVDVTNTRDAEFRPFRYDIDNFTNFFDLGIKSFGSRNQRQFTADLRGTWSERFGMFSSQFTFGSQGFITNVHARGGDGWDFPGPGLEVADAGANQVVTEGFSEVVNIGIMGQEQIGVNDWAFVTVGARWDRNSAFGEKTEGQLYPKVSASLVISDLPNWSSTTLSTLRLRGALGRSGLQPGAFDRFTTYGAITANIGGADVPALAPANLGNDSLKPEVTTEFEAGAELGLFENRLGFDVTYWSRKTTDALVPQRFPPSGGFTNTQLVNIGELEARGWELKLNWLAVDRPGLSINLFANGGYLFQRIVDMGGAPPLKVGGTYPRYRQFLIEGQPPGVLLGAQLLQPCGQTQYRLCLNQGQYPFDTNGDGVPDDRATLEAYLSVPRSLDLFNSPTGRGPLLDDNDNDGDFLDHCLSPAVRFGGGPGTAPVKKMKDKNGNEYDYCLAKPLPDWQGSFGANVTLARNVQVNVLFEYRAGNFYYSNLTDAFRNSNPLIGRNVKRVAELEAIMLNPASTPQQRADALIEYAENFKALAPYSGLNLVEKADFVRLREVGVTYNAPASFAQKLGFSSLAFNLTGRNVLLFTGYSGIDPEVNQLGRTSGGGLNDFLESTDAWGFPLPRRFTFSVRFGF
ncbi:MAG: SusC/RagA family TonB-linked outer membrane protein [Gemmatimonadales bacterium]|nr:MAG: SusC/RagA family TonB-linked outer membrane protein [Gemmatimonadales bacterium]